MRFSLDKGNSSEGISLNEIDFERVLNQYYKTKKCLMRNNYENIISEAKSVFLTEKIHIGFYENIFNSGDVVRLSKFLQIKPNVEFTGVEGNKTRISISVTDGDLKVKKHYANTYKYFYNNYPIVNEL